MFLKAFIPYLLFNIHINILQALLLKTFGTWNGI